MVSPVAAWAMAAASDPLPAGALVVTRNVAIRQRSSRDSSPSRDERDQAGFAIRREARRDRENESHMSSHSTSLPTEPRNRTETGRATARRQESERYRVKETGLP